MGREEVVRVLPNLTASLPPSAGVSPLGTAAEVGVAGPRGGVRVTC